MKQHTALTLLKASDRGFTIQEVLVAMVIALLALTAIYKTFRSQQDSFLLQEQIAAAQQNLRAGMFFTESEIQMAGCNPTGNVSPAPGFLAAESEKVQFTKDVSGGQSDGVDNDGDLIVDNDFEKHFGDGDVNDTGENITYWLSVGNLMRASGGVANIVSENIDALNFVYLDSDLAVIPAPVAAANLSDIKSVEITMVARTSGARRGYPNNTVYRNQRGTAIYTAPGDRVTRRTLSVTIQCRNL
jgi:prepilin-type N-terminal cleavage/methylation domain-containing protein